MANGTPISNNKGKLIILAIVVFLVFFYIPKPAPEQAIVQETDLIDTSNPKVQAIVSEIASMSDDTFERIKLTAERTFDMTRYQILGEECLTEKASDLIDNGFGDCSSMSKLNIAVLSGLGITSQMVSGCVTDLGPRLEISLLDRFSRETRVINFTIRKPRSLPAGLPANKLGAPGFAHAWVRAHDGKEWITVESTAGVVFPTDFEKLIGYIEFEQVNYNDGFSMCYLPSLFFKENCI